MECNAFETPVRIFVGLGVPTEIRSVTDAYRFLCDWPSATNDAAYSVAVNACKAALTGKIEAETARGMFIALARRHHLLVHAITGGGALASALDHPRLGQPAP